jgi:hypothetical protein
VPTGGSLLASIGWTHSSCKKYLAYFFFQVAIPQVLESLEAEAHALHFGAKLARTLNLQDAIIMFTDNQVLAPAVLVDRYTLILDISRYVQSLLKYKTLSEQKAT